MDGNDDADDDDDDNDDDDDDNDDDDEPRVGALAAGEGLGWEPWEGQVKRPGRKKGTRSTARVDADETLQHEISRPQREGDSASPSVKNDLMEGGIDLRPRRKQLVVQAGFHS